MKSLIMIIEDNKDIRDLIGFQLEDNDFGVLKAINGNDALEILKSLDLIPDLILCDLKMPNMDGNEFCEEMAKNPLWCQIPCIFLSTKSKEEKDIIETLKIVDYLTKPFKEKELLTAIKLKLKKDYNIE